MTERVTIEASTAEGRPERGPVYHVDVDGVPDGTIVIRFDPEGRALLDVGTGEGTQWGMTVHLPHTRDLPDTEQEPEPNQDAEKGIE